MKEDEKLTYVVMKGYLDEESKPVVVEAGTVVIAESMEKAAEILGGTLGKDIYMKIRLRRPTGKVEFFGMWQTREIDFSFDQLSANPEYEMMECSSRSEGRTYEFSHKKGLRHLGSLGVLRFFVVFDSEKRIEDKYWIQLAPLFS